MFTRNGNRLLAVAAALTITVAAAAQFGGRAPRVSGERGGRIMEFIATYLELTSAQKEQARTILEEARAAAEPLRAELEAGHAGLRDAVRANAAGVEIERLASAQGEVAGRMMAIHAKAMARLYQILTPEQKEKAEKLHEQFKNRLKEHFGRRG